MYQQAAKFITLAGAALALASCADDRSATPTTPTASTVSKATTPLTCDFTQAKADARIYFASSTDPIFTILKDMQSLYKTGGAAAATDRGWDGIARIAVAVKTPGIVNASAAPGDGNRLTLDILACTAVSVPSGFDVTLALSTGGLYDVRGNDAKDPTTAPTYSRDLTPVWAVQPSSGTWGGASGAVRFLIYGTSTTLSTLESPVTRAYDFNTLPAALAFNPALDVGVCVAADSTTRLQHTTTAATTILPLQLLDCPSLSPITSRTSGVFGSALAFAQRLAELLAPRPAFALTTRGGVGGLSSGFSPYIAVDLRRVVLTFTQQPTNGRVNQPITPPVQVLATAAGGTPLAGVPITLTVFGNNGTNVAATGTSAVTGANGVATFPALSVNKPGGYTLSATGNFDGIQSAAFTSALFNVKF